MLDPTRRLQSDVHPLMTPNLHHLWKTRSRKSKTLNFHPYMTSPDATENGWDCSSPYIADRGTPKTGLRPAYITSPKRNELEIASEPLTAPVALKRNPFCFLPLCASSSDAAETRRGRLLDANRTWSRKRKGLIPDVHDSTASVDKRGICISTTLVWLYRTEQRHNGGPGETQRHHKQANPSAESSSTHDGRKLKGLPPST